MANFSRWKIEKRRVLVDNFQWHLVAISILHFALVVLVFAGALFLPIIFQLNSGDISSPIVQSAARDFLLLHNRLWVPLLCVFLLLILHNIIVSHRIAGPLYRFRRYLRSIGEGDLSAPIQIRKKDYIHKDAEAACRMVESLRNKVIRMETQFANANEAWRNLRNSMGGAIPEGMEKDILVLSEYLDACRSSLAEFKTAEEKKPSPGSAPEPALEPAEVKS